MSKIVLKDCWEIKYIDHRKDYKEPSLKGAFTHYYDKWGAFIISRNTFGDGDRLYKCELEYIEAIKHLITIPRYEQLLAKRDKTNEEEMFSNFDEKKAVLEETERRMK